MWRKLHNEELCDLYSLPSIIKMIKSRGNEMGRACSMNGEEECVEVMGGKAGRKEITRETKMQVHGY
jgi:hypothetical protein